MRLLARIVSVDPRSATYSNIKYLANLTGLHKPECCTALMVQNALPVKKVPESERWRLGLLDNLIKIRGEKYIQVEDSRRISAMITSLCST